MDHPAAQLAQNISDAITRELALRRPLLHHLNADTSWLLQIPRPLAASRRGGRAFYNILIDPWLSGGQSEVASWWSQQWHACQSQVASIAAVEELAREIETLNSVLRNGSKLEPLQIDTLIDAVLISHEFTDHCHKETLLNVHPDVPIFAAPKAASLISSWAHFRQVIDILPFGSSSNVDWRSYSLPPLPEWLSISRLATENDPFQYHSALVIAFNTSSLPPTSVNTRNYRNLVPCYLSSLDLPDTAEAILYTPHGVAASALLPVIAASPQLHPLAFLHGLSEISINGSHQLNLGAHNGLEAQRLLQARYWVGTHDEKKAGWGLVNWFVRRNVVTLKQALEQEMKNKSCKRESGCTFQFMEVGNGESVLLK